MPGQKQRSQTGTREVLSKHQKALYCMDDGAPAQVTQRDCEVSLFGDVQKPHGYGPGQPTVDVPA